MKVYEHVGPEFPGKCRAGQKEVSTQRLSPIPSAQAGPEAAVAPMRASYPTEARALLAQAVDRMDRGPTPW